MASLRVPGAHRTGDQRSVNGSSGMSMKVSASTSLPLVLLGGSLIMPLFPAMVYARSHREKSFLVRVQKDYS